MSDVMLLGVLRMPIEYVGGPLSPIAQLVSRAREAADRIESDAATIAAERAANALLTDEVQGLRSAVQQLAALNAWANFGDCRAWTAGPILSPHEGDELARRVLRPNVAGKARPEAQP